MIPAYGYAAYDAKTPLRPFVFERREALDNDVVIDILFCGICHSDIHQARNEWHDSIYPIVPGHEIIGKVIKTGKNVTAFKTGDSVGVGCFVDSCRQCLHCEEGLEQYCNNIPSFTYNSFEQDKKTPTLGGYSNCIVVDARYCLRIPQSLALAHAAPLLCAGITTYSPLRYLNAGKNHKIGIIGIGGLGHMAIKFSHAFGAEVTALTHSSHKIKDALALGADQVILTSETSHMQKYTDYFDIILNTAPDAIDLNPYLQLLKRDGVMVVVGIPSEAISLNLSPLIIRRRKIMGSLIGGIKETQAMLDYCGQQGILPDIEIISPSFINQAYERMMRGEVKYRFVIDMKDLKDLKQPSHNHATW